MHTVKGLIKNGVIMPDEPVTNRDGERVLITFLEQDDLQPHPGLDEVVAKIIAAGPGEDSYTPPTQSLADLLSSPPTGEPVDSEEWDRQWAAIEADIKK